MAGGESYVRTFSGCDTSESFHHSPSAGQHRAVKSLTVTYCKNILRTITL